MRLTEKWLYKNSVFRKLLKYFHVEVNGKEGTVTLISDPTKISETDLNEKYRHHIFKFIEKYFITKRFVEKVMRQYVNTSHIKWYDLFNNTDILKELFSHKLKKLIIATIYQLEDKNIKKEQENIKK